MLQPWQDAEMAPDRVTSALGSLITHLVPKGAGESDDAAQERHDACYGVVKKILSECVTVAFIRASD